ncbi:MAG: phage antirepressor KilAC domain-containing protein [Selenomonadaceae bacterium]|nr:phage antirepressor KilAC domain-containing protein [Selenomonadaceae bacterium]MBR4383299.1 phage antirepressor KilAC domain-containing protein [Selenomonadaceae bacterium]
MANFVNEDGLYDVILDSRKPNAKRFRKWITSEVIPSIRKTGLYVNPNAPITGDMVIALGMRMKELEAKNAALTAQIEADAPKVSYYDLILQCPDLVSTSQIAKDYGMSAKAFNTLLHRLGVQFNQGGVWLLYQKFARLGWTSSKTHVYADENGKTHSRSHTYWTQRGRLGLYELLKRNGYLPTIEQAA